MVFDEVILADDLWRSGVTARAWLDGVGKSPCIAFRLLLYGLVMVVVDDVAGGFAMLGIVWRGLGSLLDTTWKEYHGGCRSSLAMMVTLRTL